jgi:2-oxoglutarate dehydrogenase E2 component (dihydrolipoamide succinyltransferase)
MPSEVEIRAPAEQTEGTRSQILRWLKSVGESVTENEPLIELETDKVTVEVPSPASGTLREILKQEQDEIGPGELLGRIEAAGAAIIADSGMQARAAEVNVGSKPPSVAALEGASDASVPVAAAHNLSPAVRRLLTERGLEASDVRGTGQGGRVTVADVLAQSAGAEPNGAGAVRHTTAVPHDSATAIGTVRAVAPTRTRADGVAVGHGPADVAGPSRRVPHTATRKRIADHMVQSLLHTAPHVTTVFEADLTAVLEHRQHNKDDFARRGAPLTLTAYFLQATVAAMRAVPEANSRWTDSALDVFESMHIGVATALATGLVVPVLRDVQSRDLFETAKGLDDLVSRARDGHLTPADVRGGTFTISNHGVSGSLVATPIIINQPQSAILGVGKLEKRPVVLTSEDGEDRIVIRPRCYVTLTIDHRVMDGHQANRFLQTFLEWLASPQ